MADESLVGGNELVEKPKAVRMSAIQIGQQVNIKFNGDIVAGTVLAESDRYPGSHIVEVQGKRVHRKVKLDVPPANTTFKPQIQQEEHKYDINTRFSFLEKMVDMVVAGPSISLVICGDGGIGKSYLVKQRLDVADKIEDEDYVIIKGKTTPKALYRCLYDNQDKIVIFDDCDSAFGNVDAVNILKAALEIDPTEPRKVSWLTEQVRDDDDLPNQFTFHGKVILISNMFLNQLPQTLLSRSLHVDVQMTSTEKIDRLRKISKHIKPQVEDAKKKEVLDFMASIREKIVDLNIRTFMKVVDIRVTVPEGWQDMAEYILTSGRKK